VEPVAQKGCGVSPSLEVVKTQLDAVLSNLLQLTPRSKQGGVDQMISRGPFPPHPFCNSRMQKCCMTCKSSLCKGYKDIVLFMVIIQ